MTSLTQPEETAVKLDDYTGTLVTVEDKIQTAGISIEYDIDDAISLSDDHENHTIGMKDAGNFDMDAIYTRAWAILCIGAWRAPNRKQFTANLMPEGQATGLELHSFETFMTGFEMTCDDSSTSSLNRKNKITGAVTFSAQP